MRIAQAEGIPAAVKATGIPRATVGRALRAAGIDVEGPARQRTAVASAAAAAKVAEARRDVVEQLAAQLDEVAQGVLSRVELHRRLSAAVAAVAPEHLADEASVAGMRAVARDEQLRDLLRRAELAEGAMRTGDLVRAQSALIADRRLTTEPADGSGDGERLFIVWTDMPRPQPVEGRPLPVDGPLVPVFEGERVVRADGSPVVDEDGAQIKDPRLPDIDRHGDPILDAEVVE
ncbi:hypothetical protein [Gephyromycinifex aptenodytis]|uniref:hypothetical protein n=1 Tax=Gephyromycinifex aptenodytis TaxID=2716227 RepID=UPI0014464DF2|nr:hypothetical protein [Gephyromycinifex aptenodytis]